MYAIRSYYGVADVRAVAVEDPDAVGNELVGETAGRLEPLVAAEVEGVVGQRALREELLGGAGQLLAGLGRLELAELQA